MSARRARRLTVVVVLLLSTPIISAMALPRDGWRGLEGRGLPRSAAYLRELESSLRAREVVSFHLGHSGSNFQRSPRSDAMASRWQNAETGPIHPTGK